MRSKGRGGEGIRGMEGGGGNKRETEMGKDKTGIVTKEERLAKKCGGRLLITKM